MTQPFIPSRPRTEDFWRGIILYGRNVATYKFALGRALLDLRPNAGQLITLPELAVPFAGHLCDALKREDKQGTFRGSKFLDACRSANAGQITQTQLIDKTVQLGFNNVIDAFHVVGPDEIPRRFFTDERKSGGGIRISDMFSELMVGDLAANLPVEADARWRLVETAWSLGTSPSLLDVSHDPATEALFVVDSSRRRRSITGSRGALSGYQKGHCFHCFDSFSLSSAEPPEVDHFFPHVLKPDWPTRQIDGVWNLVLACGHCNRGPGGKFARVPTIKLLERLSTRNEFLIASHHPLRETLIKQTGGSEKARRQFLSDCHKDACARRIHVWEPPEAGEPLF